MKVFKVVPRGYCQGVVNAIKIAKSTRQQYPDEPIYILGMIVHNQFIVDALNKLGIRTIDSKGKSRLELLDDIDSGVVIITAHGAGQNVFEKARQKGLIVVDSTCKDVIKTHELISHSLNMGQDILYIGKHGHPEAEGALAIHPQRIHLIQNQEDIDHLKNKEKHYVLTNQTTMSMWDVQALAHYATTQLPHVDIMKETCNATTIRQQAMAALPEEVDFLYVVGDPHSNNTTRLANIAKEKKDIPVRLIESVEDIHLDDLKGRAYIAVTAGASTPTYLTNMVIHYLEQLDIENPETYKLPVIDTEKILN
ncbi:4-hydroxy-3-methylbut-2-enyl diphosphate reductase [Beduini massiliensis]|uniref:4-hydroxy-3-methylbut-2-enyl diphosphate reductase n=1 Tax=Beduini massiliensis TaxID=1585974 RepID=UPI00059A9CD1|nr:4-hydroxy-3-methylbut-2-enyl diphosphate reductase [Beduini massiliensis]